MRTVIQAGVVLLVVGLALVAVGRAFARRRGERPAGPRFASIVAGSLLVGSAIAVLLYAVADRD